MIKIFTFIRALIFHIGVGMPKSTQQTINYRYKICTGCELFYNNQCLECGCNINAKRIFFNKLAWQDQKCPLNKW